MRELIGHKVNPTNDRLRIVVLDDTYHVTGFDDKDAFELYFQKGPINEAGVNGVTIEVLLEIIIDRLRVFQAGEFKCRENAIALTKIEEAMHWLLARTRDRMTRGVEGTLNQ